MAVLAASVDTFADFMKLLYSWLLRLSTCSSLTSRFCLRPVIGTVRVVPHDAKTKAVTTANNINFNFFIAIK